MLVELTPVFDFCIDLRTFYNIDLVQRGYYQIRTNIKIPTKYGTSRVDVHIPRSVVPSLFPATIVDGQAIGKTIEIVYAQESVRLNDYINMSVHLFEQRLDKLIDVRIELVLILELWFLEKSGLPPTDDRSNASFRCLSRRDLQLHFRPSQGLHYFRPVLFDYYHLAAVTLSIHASLVNVEEKINSKRQHFLEQSNHASPTADAKLKSYHRTICLMILCAYDSLNLLIRKYAKLLSDSHPIRFPTVDISSRLELFCQRLSIASNPWKIFEQDWQQLTTELAVIFSQFLELFRSSDQIDRWLHFEHHHARVKRFAEGFFSSDDAMHTLITHDFRSNLQSMHLQVRLVDILKKSAYFRGLPDLAVSNFEMDGTVDSSPVIFEERYLPLSCSARLSRLSSSESTRGRRSASSVSIAKRFASETLTSLLRSSLSLNLNNRNRLTKDDIVSIGDYSCTPIRRHNSNRRSTVPNLIVERERETNSLKGICIDKANSRDAIDGVALILSDSVLTPFIETKYTRQRSWAETNTDSEIRNRLDLIEENVVEFVHNKELFKEKLYLSGYDGHLCSDIARLSSTKPYFSHWTSSPSLCDVHLIVCVHGLDGTVDDLRLYRNYLRLALSDQNVLFLMSNSNQSETFSDLRRMGVNLAHELLTYLDSSSIEPKRISFICHSMGCVVARLALSDPLLSPLLDKLHCFLSLNGPHCGLLYSRRAVSWGVSLIQWWKQSRSLEQLTMRDCPPTELKQSLIYRLSVDSNLARFRYILLVGSNQDMFVPCHSALVQPCRDAQRDPSPFGPIYEELVSNILESVASSAKRTTLIRYTAFHGLTNVSRTHQIMGRAAHIAVLDDDLFIETFLTVSALQYFA